VILIDSHVLIDVAMNDPVWADWSQEQLDIAAVTDQLAIDSVVYAELSIRYASVEELDEMLDQFGIALAPIPRIALFLAGKAFQRYRAAGGVRTGVSPDFFIGAHALVTHSPLITRDLRRYRTYFPSIQLVAPD
jgi:predicted nucleic acid-binding protein